MRNQMSIHNTAPLSFMLKVRQCNPHRSAEANENRARVSAETDDQV